MDPLAVAANAASRIIEPQVFPRAWMPMVAGFGAMFALALTHERPHEILGIAAMLLAIHFGFADILPWLLRACGFAAPPLFKSHRWNLAFVEMNRLLFLKPFRRWFGRRHAITATFILSGIFHEAALSFPAGAGWGGPLLYFSLHAVLIHLRGIGRFATWLFILVPLPLLFHGQFRATFVVPFDRWLGSLLASQELLPFAITIAGIGHFLVLVASLQVPTRLGWREDIAMRTQPLARALAAQTGAFWTIRILVDIFGYDHRDWPPGNAMVTGHALLTTLLLCLAGTYWIVAVR